MREVKYEIIEHSDEYSRLKVRENRAGWGNGYIYIPGDHPIIKIMELLEIEWYDVFIGLGEEITYDHYIEDKDVYCVGFDTMHSYSNGSYNQKYVEQKAIKMKHIIDDLTTSEMIAMVHKNIHGKIAKLMTVSDTLTKFISNYQENQL